MIEFEKNNIFESELYKKNNIFKLIKSPYFCLNVGKYFKFKDLRVFESLALKDKNKGLSMGDYDIFFNLIIQEDIFYNTLRDIFLKEGGFRI